MSSITFHFFTLLVVLVAGVGGNMNWGRVEFLRYRDYCIRLEGGSISCFDHDEEVEIDNPVEVATFRDNEGNIISDEEEDDEGEYGQPLDLELPDNPLLTNIPLQHYYDGLLLSGYSCSDPPNAPLSPPTPALLPPSHQSSLSSRCILPGSILCPVVPSRRSNAILNSLHSSSWRTIKSVENTLADKVEVPEEAILLRGVEEGVEEGDDWIEFLSSACLVRRGETVTVHPIPSSVAAGDVVSLDENYHGRTLTHHITPLRQVSLRLPTMRPLCRRFARPLLALPPVQSLPTLH